MIASPFKNRSFTTNASGTTRKPQSELADDIPARVQNHRESVCMPVPGFVDATKVKTVGNSTLRRSPGSQNDHGIPRRWKNRLNEKLTSCATIVQHWRIPVGARYNRCRQITSISTAETSTSAQLSSPSQRARPLIPFCSEFRLRLPNSIT
jgi:hypothetical protein